jgi:hypothetical protein
MVKRLVALGFGLLLVILPLAGLIQVLSSSHCRAPIFLNRNHHPLGNPTPPLAAIIQQAGGLPRSAAEMNADDLTFSLQTGVGPVASWRIMGLTVADSTPLHTRVLDDDPTYAITMDVEVHYADGSVSVLRWTTWRYGLVLCPIVIPYEDGPAWRIAPLD